MVGLASRQSNQTSRSLTTQIDRPLKGGHKEKRMRTILIVAFLATLLTPSIGWAQDFRPDQESGSEYQERERETAPPPAEAERPHEAPRDREPYPAPRDGVDGRDGAPGPQGPAGASGTVVYHHIRERIYLRPAQPTYEARSRKARAEQWAALSRVNGTTQAAAKDATTAKADAKLALERSARAAATADTAHQMARKAQQAADHRRLAWTALALIGAVIVLLLIGGGIYALARR